MPNNYSKYETEEVHDINTQLDPRLQKVILQSKARMPIDAGIGRASEDGGQVVDVTGQLRNPAEPVAGLNVVRTIDDIVTATVNARDINEVRRNANVRSMKPARRVKPAMRFSVPEVRGTQVIVNGGLPNGSPQINGAGVVIGIVDYGCDFVHRNFRNADGSTRLKFFWDQGTRFQTAISPAGFGYGREFNDQAINAALQSADPYQALAYDTGSAAHGTHVMDIAAGNGRATGVPGVA